MIKLMNNQQIYESLVYSHIGSNGGTEYTLTHNFGKNPDKICCYAQVNGRWHELMDYFNTNTGNSYGWAVGSTEDSTNQSKVTVFNTYGGGTTYNIKFVAYILGTTQTIINITPAFQWSTSEQVWPFEKDRDGKLIYCKEIYLGNYPNTGTKNVAHGISNFDRSTQMHKLEGFGSWGDPIPYPDINGLTIGFYMTNTNVVIRNSADYSSQTGYARLYYTK
jgi:hypothetical protein